MRAMTQAIRLSPDNLVLPLFVHHGSGIRREIASMPGQFQLSPDLLGDTVHAAAQLGVGGFILFGIPETKDALYNRQCRWCEMRRPMRS